MRFASPFSRIPWSGDRSISTGNLMGGSVRPCAHHSVIRTELDDGPAHRHPHAPDTRLCAHHFGFLDEAIRLSHISHFWPSNAPSPSGPWRPAPLDRIYDPVAAVGEEGAGAGEAAGAGVADEESELVAGAGEFVSPPPPVPPPPSFFT